MREKNPSQIGLETELKCQLFLIEQGFNVLIPLGNYLKYDLVIEKNNKFYTIQVKHAHPKCEFSFAVNTKYDKRNEGKVVKCPYEIGEIDYFLTEYQNKFYLFPVFGTTETRFWLKESGIKIPSKKYAKDFEAEKILNNL